MEPEVKKMRVDTKCVLRFAKLTENAFEPVKGSAKAAGFDLRSAYDCSVPARGKQLVKTDLQIQVPEGSYGRVAPRSGLAVKNFIDVGAGVVDEDYRGNLGVVLFNHSDTDFEVKKGDRIAQLICEKIFYPELEQLDSLDHTERGEGGFGSTGVKDLPQSKNGHDAVDSTKVDLGGGAYGSTGLKELLQAKNGNGVPKSATESQKPNKV
ncbi:deoxyuridine 5'-triphosphate nucleotidohydrolase [Episyrphus balteatus]|uniref:deoxyuridine 5'-triphosphate nucleotidohydrolase n=1 Tax=Episyrphus balteatus TaxID=286459 RepID=UPI00248619B1|nr:deoxyuridine 5'-triphosphate nucleotidohydrolase [Episyrphus balteatus]